MASLGVSRRNGGWQARPYVNGEKHYVPGAPFATKAEATEAARKFVNELLDKGAGKVDGRTCRQAFAAYRDRHLRHKSLSTQQTAERAIERFLELHGDTPLAALDGDYDAGQAFADDFTKSTVDPVSTWLNWCAHPRQDYIKANPLRGAIPLPSTEQAKYVPTEAEVRELAAQALETCAAHPGLGLRMQACILFTAGCGERAGEVAEVRWRDIDFENDIVYVEAAACPVTNDPKAPKNGQRRAIPLMPLAREGLELLPRGLPDTYVFTLTAGNKLSKSKRHYWFDKIRRDAKLPGHVRFHDLRHHCATRLAEKGIEPWIGAKVLGHTDGGELFRRRYAHPRDDLALRLALELDQGAGPDAAPTPDSPAPDADRTLEEADAA